MVNQQMLLEWQKQREEDDRRWRKEEAERAERALKQSQRQYLVSLVVYGLLLTAVSVAAQILAAYIRTGP